LNFVQLKLRFKNSSLFFVEMTFSNLDDLIDRSKASEILDMHERSINRYIARGYDIPKYFFDDDNKVYFNRGDVLLLKYFTDNYESMKQLFMLNERMGESSNNVNKDEFYSIDGTKSVFSHWDNSLDSGMEQKSHILKLVDFYQTKRSNYLSNKYGVDNPDSVFLVEEVLFDLKLTDRHVIYDLMNEDYIKKVYFGKTKNSEFIDRESYFEYLDEYVHEFLYRTMEVSEMIDISIYKIDTIAKKNNLGFKIKKSPSGNYLFSVSDIDKIEEIAKK
jgi:hypothetical protein